MIEFFELSVENEIVDSNRKVEEMVALARRLKAEQCGFIIIFEITGLQPGIIQSL
mgnify:CR=1 FL=1